MMKILFAAGEAAPFIKTGGLGEVTGSLAKALVKAGLDVRVAIPKYRAVESDFLSGSVPVLCREISLGFVGSRVCQVEKLERDGIIFYFINNDYLFNRPEVYGSWDDGERFAFYCRAVLECLPGIGFQPDIIHCHDWHAAMIPLLLDACCREKSFYSEIRTVLTIHNLKFQGIFPESVLGLLELSRDHFNPDSLEYYGQCSYLKGGIAHTDALTTVSPTYAKEILTASFGEGLDGFLRSKRSKVYGILNGIDDEIFDPVKDPNLTEKFQADDLRGKKRDKAALQAELGLSLREDLPLVTMVGRLAAQKGLDLILPVLEEILKREIQLVILGSGEKRFEEAFREWAGKCPHRMAVQIGFQDPLARRIYAAGDIFLMPSLFEPCGIGQMIAVRYGNVPLVRATGGLKDTVFDFREESGEGNGFTFAGDQPDQLLAALDRAINAWQQPLLWTRIVENGMKMDFSWKLPAREYISLYHKLLFP